MYVYIHRNIYIYVVHTIADRYLESLLYNKLQAGLRLQHKPWKMYKRYLKSNLENEQINLENCE